MIKLRCEVEIEFAGAELEARPEPELERLGFLKAIQPSVRAAQKVLGGASIAALLPDERLALSRAEYRRRLCVSCRWQEGAMFTHGHEKTFLDLLRDGDDAGGLATDILAYEDDCRTAGLDDLRIEVVEWRPLQ